MTGISFVCFNNIGLQCLRISNDIEQLFNKSDDLLVVYKFDMNNLCGLTWRLTSPTSPFQEPFSSCEPYVVVTLKLYLTESVSILEIIRKYVLAINEWAVLY